MPEYSPTWIYLGNDSTQINPMGGTTGTTFDQAKVVEGWEFPASGMQGVKVTGNATNSGDVNFGRGVDRLRYDLSDGNGVTVHREAVYTSHVVVNVNVSVARDAPPDPLHPNAPVATIRDVIPLRGVIIQMANGDLFMRPFFSDVTLWNNTLNTWGLTKIEISSINDPTSVNSTDRGTGGLSASASFNPAFFKEGTFVPCFAAGTLILTDCGEITVEHLRKGDRVWTLDNGLQTIRWIGGHHVDLAQSQHLAPIRIKAGALGNDRPERDLMVSPQHRILVRSAIAQQMFGAAEVPVAAKQLTTLPGIEIATDIRDVRYFHILFDHHEIVLSNGAETESLYTGPEVLDGLDPIACKEIFELFPQLRDRTTVPAAARPLAPGRRARNLATRHQGNSTDLVN